ncbi:MAG TPA: hypothetical protein PK765_00980 [bacterium]|nr:hypothetical protein [bacterium]
MLELTPTQSKIVEALKAGAKTSYDLEQEIDRGKDFSTDYIKVMIHKINKKRKIIDSFYRDGQRYWRLMESEEHVEYQILSGVNDLLEDSAEMMERISETRTGMRATKTSAESTARKVDMMDTKVDSIQADVRTAREAPNEAVRGLYIQTNWILLSLVILV